MFTGIVQGVATVQSIVDRPGLRSFTLSFPPGFTAGLSSGASVSVDGVCLTVTQLPHIDVASFDVMQQTMSLTTLGAAAQGSQVNVERASQVGAEVGGHPLSGHIDFTASIAQVRTPQNNHVLRMAVSAPWMRYLFAKGYIAVNGASLTIAQAHRARDGSGWFDVWLIPETLRMTTFARKKKSDLVNVEVDRQTQIIVDTVRDTVDKRIEALLRMDVAASVDRVSQSIGGLGKMATKKKAKKKAAKKVAKKGKTRSVKPREDSSQGGGSGGGAGPHMMKPHEDSSQGGGSGGGAGPHAKAPKKKK